MIGALLVAFEVVQQYCGSKFDVTEGIVLDPIVFNQEIKETKDFRTWDHRKYHYMKWGLVCLMIGSILPIILDWV